MIVQHIQNKELINEFVELKQNKNINSKTTSQVITRSQNSLAKIKEKKLNIHGLSNGKNNIKCVKSTNVKRITKKDDKLVDKDLNDLNINNSKYIINDKDNKNVKESNNKLSESYRLNNEDINTL